MTPLTLAVVVGNILTGQFLGRVGRVKWPMLDGSGFLLVGAVVLLLLTANSPLWLLTIGMILVGFGLGQIMPVMTIVVQETVERKDLGVGTSVVQFFRSIGSTLGTAIVGTIVTNSYTAGIEGNPATNRLPPQLLQAVEEPQSLLNSQLTGRLPTSVIEAIRNALSDAIHNGFIVTLVVGILALLLVLTLPGLQLKSASRVRAKATPDNAGEGLAQAGQSSAMTADTVNRPPQLETGAAADSSLDRPGEGAEEEEPRSTFSVLD